MTGKGTTPEYVMNYLLKENGLAHLMWTSSSSPRPPRCVPSLKQDSSAIGVLPQPFATAACIQNLRFKNSAGFNGTVEHAEQGQRKHAGDRRYPGTQRFPQGEPVSLLQTS